MTARISLLVTQFKRSANSPDLWGSVHLPVSLIQELAWYVANNQRLSQSYEKNPELGVTVRVTMWNQQPNPEKPNGPVLTGVLESPAETDRKAQERAAAQAAQPAPAQQQWGAPAYGQPAAAPAYGPTASAPAPAYGQAPPPPYPAEPKYAPPAKPSAPPAYGPPAGYGQASGAPLI